MEAVRDVRSPGTDVELEVTRLMPGLVPAAPVLVATGRLPAGAVVDAIDMLDPGLLPGAVVPIVLRTVVEPIALIGLRMVDGGLGCGTKGAVPEVPPETVRVVPIRAVPLATLFTPCVTPSLRACSPDPSISCSSSGPFLFLPSACPGSNSPFISS